ncbi:L-threonylcarbamoyladenylate synthase [Aquirufa sp. HETE-83D]|jgi:tRNA threonylcarbamoyl adenosine modification protein (Sua5/YciO/YrdC/YwlC family)|uniref:L-threonylcarbamoyladenylate synthase n=1 Tax=Aquirufa esocilacus TaxID=3096513 RepID=A0ABW6DM47_9BACT
MAEIIRLYDKNNSQATIELIVKALDKDAVIIYKTDTMYALGCHINSTKAVNRICEIKGIQASKNRFSFICADLSSIANYAKVSDFAFKTLKRYLPGAFTFVLPASAKVPSILVQGKKTVGIRIPDYEPILSIVEVLGAPLLTTSLPHDHLEVEEYTDPSLILDQWGHAVDLILDGGFGGHIPSSVVEITDDSVDIIREGAGDCSDFN